MSGFWQPGFWAQSFWQAGFWGETPPVAPPDFRIARTSGRTAADRALAQSRLAMQGWQLSGGQHAIRRR